MRKKMKISARIMVLALVLMSVTGTLSIDACSEVVASNTVASTPTVNIVSPNVVAGSRSHALISGGQLEVSASFGIMPASDDGKLYLYELKTYEYGIPQGRTPIAEVPLRSNVSAFVPLGADSGGVPRLVNKFVFAVRSGGVLTLVTDAQYVGNPEALASAAIPRRPRPVKATQAAYVLNFQLSGLPQYPNFGKDHVVLLNYHPNTIFADPGCMLPDAHPVVRNQIMTYMFNAETDAGVIALFNDCRNIAAQSGGQDFVIGNEVNQRCWNYTSWCDWDTFVRKYVQAFRVCYTAIKSVNPNARVYTSIDQVWDKNPTGSDVYEFIDGRDFLIKFNNMMVQNGNIDWDISIHPYPNPLYWAKFWDPNSIAGGAAYKAQVDNNQVLTFQNLSALTSLLCTPTFLNRQGQVRDVIIGEIGMGTNAGIDNQAAGVCASWAALERNPYVTQYLYLENDVNGYFGSLKGRGKEAFEAMGTPKEKEYMDWAKSYIGISDWSSVLR